jgi:hypothetical protein
MSEDVSNTNPDVTPEMEMKLLKERADLMKINYAPNIGLETLRERVNSHLQGDESKEEETPKEQSKPVATNKEEELDPVRASGLQPKTVAQLKLERISEMRKDALRLRRVVVQCMNPNKKDWPGEIFTMGNGIIGTVKKFVPFGVEEGYHIPNVIYEYLKTRKYQHFVKEPIPGTRQTKLVPTMSREFAIELLDPLTPEEMDELKQRQALNHSID